MKKNILLVLSLLLVTSCSQNQLHPSDVLHQYYEASSYTIEFCVVSDNLYAIGKAYFTEHGVYNSLLYEDEEMVVAYAEDEGGIFDFIIVDGKVRATSPYYGDEDGNTIHGLYNLIPSFKLVDEDALDNLTTKAEQENTYVIDIDAYKVLIDIVGLSSDNLSIVNATLKIDDSKLIFNFNESSGIAISLEFKDLNITKIADLDEYLANGGSYDQTSSKVQSLMSGYNYISYLYSNNELYAIEYYNENYYFTDYADPSEVDDGFIGVPSGSGYVSGIYHFTKEGNNNVVLDSTPVDISSNNLRNVFTYPGDLNIVSNLGNLEYSPLNDAYISYEITDAVEIAQLYGLEEYINLLYPYCSAVQFKEDISDFARSKVGIWYVYDYDGEIGVYSKEFTDFGLSHVDFIEDFLENL